MQSDWISALLIARPRLEDFEVLPSLLGLLKQLGVGELRRVRALLQDALFLHQLDHGLGHLRELASLGGRERLTRAGLRPHRRQLSSGYVVGVSEKLADVRPQAHAVGPRLRQALTGVDVLGRVGAVILAGLGRRRAQPFPLYRPGVSSLSTLDGNYPPPGLVVAHSLIAPLAGYSSADRLTIIKIGTDIAIYSPGSLSGIRFRFQYLTCSLFQTFGDM